jgi:glycosyltransferase involved in cell wall biosynthesis
MKIRVLTTSYNAIDWIDKTIDSIQNQTITDFKVYITDDLSTDNSREYVKGLIAGDNRFELIENTEKLYQPGNYWSVLQRKEIDNEDIIITIDGDDWLPTPTVFERVLRYYSENSIWLTCGQFLEYHGENKYKMGFVSKPTNFKNLRTARWTSSHLRTFKAGLFRLIKKEDLYAPSGNFWESTGDLSFMFPMLEMAGESRIKYITNDINLIYNVATPLNDFKVNLKQQLDYARLIRSKPKYKELDIDYNFS